MTTKKGKLSPLQHRLQNQRWGPLAYSYLVCAIVTRVAKYTWLYIMGRTPSKQPYSVGASVAMLFPAIECLSIHQCRSFMRTAVSIVQFRAGLGTEAKRAKWAVKVKGEGWQGYWIPFQDQIGTGNGKEKGKMFNPSEVPLGAGCDIVVIAIHGGGFIDGHALMFLNVFRNWMKSTQTNQGLKIGVLSVEYGLSPENPYPVAIDEVIASYRDLVTQHGVNSRKIVLLGDSAGGNICLGTSLKLRDAFSDLGSPAGEILISPWVRSPEPLESSLFDVVSEIGCEIYAEAYTQDNPGTFMCTYTSPYSAPTLAGLRPMLMFIGGVEILRPSIESFVSKARMDGVEVTTQVGEDRSHNYLLLNELSTKHDREEAYKAMGDFVLDAHHRFTQSITTSSA